MSREGECSIDYHDTGRGVERDELEKIFDRFYRIDADRAKPVGGSGLGLSCAMRSASTRAVSAPIA